MRLVTTPEQALAELTAGPDAVAVLDLTMPGLDPLRIRRALRTPVIFLVALRRAPGRAAWPAAGRPAAAVAGPALRPASAGGHGPRRAGRAGAAAGRGRRRTGRTGRRELRLDLAGRCVRADGQPVKLTATETAILAALLGQQGRVLSRRQ